MAVPGWADDELIFDGCCCSEEDAKSTSTITRGGSWVASGGRRLAVVGKGAEMRLLVGARIESGYSG